MTTRCTGHCCRVFSLGYGPEEMDELRSKGVDGEKIAEMVIYLGHHLPGTLEGSPMNESPHALHYYTCKHHDRATGDCLNYENRPAMCSEFPYREPCPYEACADTDQRYDVPATWLGRKLRKTKEATT